MLIFKSFKHQFRNLLGRCRILPGHEPAVANGKGFEIRSLRINAAGFPHSGFQQERNDPGQFHLLFFRIAEPGNVQAAHKSAAILPHGKGKCGRPVTHRTDNGSALPRIRQELPQYLTRSQVPHCAVPARNKDGLVILVRQILESAALFKL